jgi:hypothetical protein
MRIIHQEITKENASYGLYMENIEKLFFHDGVLSIKTKTGEKKTYTNHELFWILERGLVNVEEFQLREISLQEYERIWD